MGFDVSAVRTWRTTKPITKNVQAVAARDLDLAWKEAIGSERFQAQGLQFGVAKFLAASVLLKLQRQVTHI